MTLGYQVTEPFVIPDEAYNADDIATIVVTGRSDGGMWALNAISTHTPPMKLLPSAPSRPTTPHGVLIWQSKRRKPG